MSKKIALFTFFVNGLLLFADSTLLPDSLTDKDMLVLRGEQLSLEDCKKIGKLKNLKHLKLGGRIEGVILPPSGLDEILKNKQIERLELYIVNFGQINLKPSNFKGIKELVVGGGPYIFGYQSGKKKGIKEYNSIIKNSMLSIMFNMSKLDSLEIDAPREIFDLDLHSKSIKKSKIKKVVVWCSGFKGDLSLFNSMIETQDFSIKTQEFSIKTPLSTVTINLGLNASRGKE